MKGMHFFENYCLTKVLIRTLGTLSLFVHMYSSLVNTFGQRSTRVWFISDKMHHCTIATFWHTESGEKFARGFNLMGDKMEGVQALVML